MPHPHSLFLLAGHHHHHDGSLEDDEHEHEHGHEHDQPAMQPGNLVTPGPVVQAATPEGVSGEQISLAVEEFRWTGWSGVSEPFAWPRHSPLMSIAEPPDPPPPRSPSVITWSISV